MVGSEEMRARFRVRSLKMQSTPEKLEKEGGLYSIKEDEGLVCMTMYGHQVHVAVVNYSLTYSPTNTQ